MKKIVLTLGLTVCVFVIKAQDYHYSLFTMAPLTINPALTGNFTGDLRIINNYRMQWTPIKPFTTYTFGGDMQLKRRGTRKGNPDFFAVGLNVNLDKAGSTTLKNNTYNALFSYNKCLDGAGYTFFSVGGLLGLSQRSISTSATSWGAQWNGLQYDSNLPTGEIAGFQDAFFYFDAGVGAAITITGNERFRMNAGVGAFHLNRPRIDFLGQTDKLYMRLNFHWKAEIAVGRSDLSWLVPQIQVVQHGPARMINVGLGNKIKFSERSRYTGYRNEKSVTFGGMYRVGDAVAGYLRIDVGSVGAGICYDYNMSKLNPATRGMGAVEFMLIYTGIYSNVNSRTDHPAFF
jgi:type IX secretion system PorP/SprF family membrane protein